MSTKAEDFEEFEEREPKNNERYGQLELLLEITRAFANAGRYSGLSIRDIQDMFGISRSTVMRMKLVINRFFGLEETYNSQFHREKKWYLSPLNLKDYIGIRPEDIALLESCKKVMKNSGHASASEALERFIENLNIINSKKISDVDVEALLESEGFAIRQAPKLNIPKDSLKAISDAVLAFKQIQFDYTSLNGEVKTVKAEPYGIVYGSKINLLAHKVDDENPQTYFRYYTITKMNNIKVLNEFFTPKEDFNLKEYLKNSFGIFQEKELLDVKLKFDKSAADSVLNYNFHPSQKMEQLENGDVIVTFKACGTYEMCWHFFTWGSKCQILAPQSLKDKYKELLQEALTTLN